MKETNYSQTCSKILNSLSLKQKEVILRRFGLEGKKKETLESIGKDFGITRERVRQIERDGFLDLQSEAKKHQKIFNHFKNILEKKGGLKREDLFLQELGKGKFQNEICFLLTISNNIERIGETKEFHSLWAIDRKTWESAQKTINFIEEQLNKVGKPLKLEELNDLSSLKPAILSSYLEVSKKIQRNEEGLFGLKEWPEINPRTIKDKAYLAFRKTGKPLHFMQVANIINSAIPQTVHNELIKDSRFVLVGRGTYALKEWGYEQGIVKDVIASIIRAAGRPLGKEEILEKTLKQRLVKENTVFLNLSNKKYFLRNSEGYYTIKEA